MLAQMRPLLESLARVSISGATCTGNLKLEATFTDVIKHAYPVRGHRSDYGLPWDLPVFIGCS